MTNEELNTLSEEVREEGLHQGNSMKDLVFNPVTGDFEQVPRGTYRGPGDVVTEMTEKGFAAAETDEIVCLREDEVRQAEDMLVYDTTASAYVTKKEEGVFHLRLSPEKGFVPAALFTKSHDLLKNNPASGDKEFIIVLENGSARAFHRTDDWRETQLMFIPSEDNLFSRSKGILEVGVLKDKRALIVGLGSFGSQIAIELAKAGVGHFVLMDFDRVEPHNLPRHTGTIHDLGRLKTNVIEEAILGKNPYAQITKYPVNINEHLALFYAEVEKADLVICATDNNPSRFNISKALVEKGKVGIFGRAFTRAEGGDVFRYRPGGPCYCCLVGSGNLYEEEITNVASARRDGRIAAYVSEEDADAMVQVGLSSDIEPICNMMVKLSLVELSRGTESGIACLEKELSSDYYIWANRRERHFANWKQFPGAGGMPTILRWYGAHIAKEEGCPICSDRMILDDDTSVISGLDDIEVDIA